MLDSNPGIQFENPNLYKPAHVNKQANKRKRKSAVNKENINISIEPDTQLSQGTKQLDVTTPSSNSNTFTSNTSNSNINSLLSSKITPRTQSSFEFINYDDDKTNDGAPPILASQNSNFYSFNYEFQKRIYQLFLFIFNLFIM